VKSYPAIDVRTGDADILLAMVDDQGPTAVEERGTSVRVFFSSSSDRDAAQRTLVAQFDVTAVDVPDQDWAGRSQETLKAITVGRITVAPPWAAVSSRLSALGHESVAISHPASASPEHAGATARLAEAPEARRRQPSAIEIVIVPSMGFGTGHHVTTRLCLAALQTIDLTGRSVLDVGTGSGVLAIAAVLLGAASALGIDNDPDAIQSARESLDLNPGARDVRFETIDLAAREWTAADIVTANLTGALLIRSAPALRAAVRPHGTLILSGIQSAERDEVRQAFGDGEIGWEREEDGWVGLAVKKP
jgi:ribosomal protein L11 methylase PrmA